MAGIPTPERPVKRWLKRPFVYDVTIAVIAFIGAVYSALLRWGSGQEPDAGRNGAAVFGFILATMVLAATLAKIIVQRLRDESKESTHELEGCLHTLHAVLVAFPPEIPDCRLRITIHVPIDTGKQLQQVVEYVGDDRGGKGKVGRKFPSHCGIIGATYRESTRLGKAHFVAAFRKTSNTEDYVRELINEWHYPQPMARELNASSMSWMAIALMLEDKVLGIVYMDSTERDFFTDEKQLLAVDSAVGISRFVRKRYF